MLDGEALWVLTVAGKGGRKREVPIVEAVMRCLDEDLAARGLSVDPRDAAPDAPLIAALVGEPGGTGPAGARTAPRGMAAQGAEARLPAAQLYRELKRVFAAASAGLQAGGARGAARVAWPKSCSLTSAKAMRTAAKGPSRDTMGLASVGSGTQMRTPVSALTHCT